MCTQKIGLQGQKIIFRESVGDCPVVARMAENGLETPFWGLKFILSDAAIFLDIFIPPSDPVYIGIFL